MANLLKQYFKNEISLTMTLTENLKTTITNDNGMVKLINSVKLLSENLALLYTLLSSFTIASILIFIIFHKLNRAP